MHWTGEQMMDAVIKSQADHAKTAQLLCNLVNRYLEKEGEEPICTVPQEIEYRIGKGEIGPQIRVWYRMTDNTSLPYDVWVAIDNKHPGFIASETVNEEI